MKGGEGEELRGGDMGKRMAKGDCMKRRGGDKVQIRRGRGGDCKISCRWERKGDGDGDRMDRVG